MQRSRVETGTRVHPRAARQAATGGHNPQGRSTPSEAATAPVARALATGLRSAIRAVARLLSWAWSHLARVLASGARRLRPAWLGLPAWLPDARSGRRSLGMTAVLAGALLVLGGRLVQVQVLDAPELRARSIEQAQRTLELPIERGRILDRNGAVLAASVERAAVIVDPAVYTEFHADDEIDAAAGEVSRSDAAGALSAVLDDVSRATVRSALLEVPTARFAYVKKNVKWEDANPVLDLELPGVHLVAESEREYSTMESSAPLLGFVDSEGTGKSGLEQQYDSLLAGRPGKVHFEVDARAALDIATTRRHVESSVPGQDLVLTIDRELQGIAMQVAGETMAAHDAEAVSIVVLDASTSEVLAAVSTPSFDPLDLQTGEDWSARPFTVTVEPGSVQKIVTVAAALEDGVIDADTVINVPASWTVAGKTWPERHPGPMTPGQIIERSSNVGSMKIGELLGPERLHDWLLAFGYGRPTGSGFPGETAGQVLDVGEWSATSLPTIAIGHGVSMSTIQLASAYQTIANDGVRVPPTLVRGALDDAGELVLAEPAPGSEVISSTTAVELRRMLQQVVEGEFGTGGLAAIEGYTVGGKTGTADKALTDGSGYSNETTAVFAGMAPIDDPELVIAVMVDEPATTFGGLSAASAFSKVMAHALVIRDVVPDTRVPSIDEAIASANSDAAAHAAAVAAEQARIERQHQQAVRRAVRLAMVAAGASEPAAEAEEAGRRRTAQRTADDTAGGRDGRAGTRTGQRAGRG